MRPPVTLKIRTEGAPSSNVTCAWRQTCHFHTASQQQLPRFLLSSRQSMHSNTRTYGSVVLVLRMSPMHVQLLCMHDDLPVAALHVGRREPELGPGRAHRHIQELALDMRRRVRHVLPGANHVVRLHLTISDRITSIDNDRALCILFLHNTPEECHHDVPRQVAS